jgi:hypothetical protein
MLEMGTSGLMSGDGKRGGYNVSTRVRPRLYNTRLPKWSKLHRFMCIKEIPFRCL